MGRRPARPSFRGLLGDSVRLRQDLLSLSKSVDARYTSEELDQLELLVNEIAGDRRGDKRIGQLCRQVMAAVKNARERKGDNDATPVDGFGQDFIAIAREHGHEIPGVDMGGIGSGKQAKSQTLKILHGSDRPDRDKRRMKLRSKPVKPKGMDKLASAHWTAIVKQRGPWLDKGDEAGLRLLCETWSLLRRTYDLYTADIADFRLRASFCALLESWNKQSQKYGLDPRSRESLGPEESDDLNSEIERKFLA